jgi:hypothetical protein
MTTKFSLSTLCALALLLSSNVSFADSYCSVTSDFHNTYGGHGGSQVEARANALQACAEGAGNGMFCESQVSCQTTQERPDYRRWAPAPATFYCSITSDFRNTYGGRGYTQVEARANALQACTEGAGNGMFCEESAACQQE